MFLSLENWTVEHICSVFEARSEDDCRDAIENTFAHDIEFFMNGTKYGLPQLAQFVLAMVTTSDFKLKVEWKLALGIPQDELNQVCNTQTHG